MVLLHNVVLHNVRETGGNLWDKSRVFWKLFLKKKKEEEGKKTIMIGPPPPQQIKTERLSRGDFQLLAFAHKPIWKKWLSSEVCTKVS